MKYADSFIIDRDDEYPILFYVPVASRNVFKIFPNEESVVGFEYKKQYYSYNNNIGLVSDKVLIGTDNIHSFETNYSNWS